MRRFNVAIVQFIKWQGCLGPFEIVVGASFEAMVT